MLLAAGLGRRFGGLKQLTPVGPHGEALMDYTVFDALRAGFKEVILVVSDEAAPAIRSHVEKGFGRHINFKLVRQKTDNNTLPLPLPRRVKPWGTGQAVLAAEAAVNGPFAVANADDFYGFPAIRALGDFLKTAQTQPPTWAMVGFAVADTLPMEGNVSRGLLKVRGGYLQGIEEVVAIQRNHDGTGVWTGPDGPRVIAADFPVSMNLWGLGPEIFFFLNKRFQDFLLGRPTPEEEFYLPECVGDAVAASIARVKVLSAASNWCGMTSSADLPDVQTKIKQLVDEGDYPGRLWA